MPDAPPTEDNNKLAQRITTLENVLKLEERLSSLEASLAERSLTSKARPSWWRDAKTVTILGALLAAVIPLVTAIDGILKNRGEAQKALIEQQDKIRQTYLDRVLKPGIAEDEQQRIFSLLLKLRNDPEFQEWAKEEHDRATAKISELIKEKLGLEEQNKKLLTQLETEKLKSPKLTRQQDTLKSARVRRLESELVQANDRVSEIQRRIGEGATGNAICADGTTISCQAMKCSCIDNVGCRGYNSLGELIKEIPCPPKLGDVFNNVSNKIK